MTSSNKQHVGHEGWSDFAETRQSNVVWLGSHAAASGLWELDDVALRYL